MTLKLCDARDGGVPVGARGMIQEYVWMYDCGVGEIRDVEKK